MSDRIIDNLSLIVAMSENRVIGRDGDMPWHISDDLRRFKKLTMDCPIIMGRKTFESIGRLLPGRVTIVITRQTDFELPSSKETGHVVSSFNDALDLSTGYDQVFVVGGGQIYEMALPFVNTIYLTRVHTVIKDGDTFFPEIDWAEWNLSHRETHAANERNDFDFSFETYSR